MPEFSLDHLSARAGFIRAAARLGAAFSCYHNPLPGPKGETLQTTCALIGPADADRVLVSISGAHGAEGFAGTGMQIAQMGAHRAVPGVAFLYIHAINPWGLAWIRRTTEEGVDLNRNFVDFDAPLPENPGYVELADHFVTESIDESALRQAEKVFADYQARNGLAAYLAARGAGQFTHPNGLFHGGRAPTWARRTTEAILADFDLAGRKVAVVDLHTGLGPYAYGEPISGAEPGSAAARRLRDWYGPTLTQPEAGGSVITPQVGMAHLGWHAVVGAGLTFTFLEFGTLTPALMQRALCRDHWLHTQGEVDWEAPLTKGIKAGMMEAYIPARRDWHEMTAFRATQVHHQALDGLLAQ